MYYYCMSSLQPSNTALNPEETGTEYKVFITLHFHLREQVGEGKKTTYGKAM